MDDLLTTHDVARILGIHPFTVGRYLDQGLLKGFKTAGGHRRISVSELRHYLVEHDMEIPAELAGAGGRLKLLVVDDEQPVLNAIKRAFKPFAAEVELTMTTSGVEALLMLGELKPDAMLIDVNMPGFDGFEVCQRVTGFKPLANVKLVAMTALHRSDIIGSALRAGAVACLGKPIDPREVLALVHTPGAGPLQAAAKARRRARVAAIL